MTDDVEPWLTLGFSLGIENWKASFGHLGMYPGTIGVTALYFAASPTHVNLRREGVMMGRVIILAHKDSAATAAAPCRLETGAQMAQKSCERPRRRTTLPP